MGIDIDMDMDKRAIIMVQENMIQTIRIIQIIINK